MDDLDDIALLRKKALESRSRKVLSKVTMLYQCINFIIMYVLKLFLRVKRFVTC